MQWENLTSLDFAEAVATCEGVGIIPIGVVEAHSSHLPLGTDMFTAHWTACRAAKQEPMIVFPQYPFSINHETAHLPGGLVIKRELAFALLENICDEMWRNGLRKIILLSGHGGNRHFLPLFVQTLPEKAKPYVVYYADLPTPPEVRAVLEHPENGHACEGETSMILHIRPELVKMEQMPKRPFTNQRRNQPISARGGYTQADWYAMYPHMYVGDAHRATAAKGETMLLSKVTQLAALVRAIKADAVTPVLVAEFLARQTKPQPPAFWTEG
jgi:creatinine amidohydrolase